MVKILSYKQAGGMIFVTTDNESRPTFTYFEDKFASLSELKKEIEKSISFEQKRKAKSEVKKNALLADFAKEKINITQEV